MQAPLPKKSAAHLKSDICEDTGLQRLNEQARIYVRYKSLRRSGTSHQRRWLCLLMRPTWDSMKVVSPLLVTLSVTIVVPGYFLPGTSL